MSARRAAARLAGFSAGYALVVLLERIVARLDAQARAAELERLAELTQLADLRRARAEADRRRASSCRCSSCLVAQA